MKYLVDANVLSEPTKPLCVQKVADWMDEHESELAVNPVVMGEIWRGVDALPDGRKKRELVVWFAELHARMRSLDWVVETAVVWAEMANRIKRSGYTVGIMDTMIAATARQHGLTVATRNMTDFTRCGVPVINPYE